MVFVLWRGAMSWFSWFQLHRDEDCAIGPLIPRLEQASTSEAAGSAIEIWARAGRCSQGVDAWIGSVAAPLHQAADSCLTEADRGSADGSSSLSGTTRS